MFDIIEYEVNCLDMKVLQSTNLISQSISGTVKLAKH